MKDLTFTYYQNGVPNYGNTRRSIPINIMNNIKNPCVRCKVSMVEEHSLTNSRIAFKPNRTRV